MIVCMRLPRAQADIVTFPWHELPRAQAGKAEKPCIPPMRNCVAHSCAYHENGRDNAHPGLRSNAPHRDAQHRFAVFHLRPAGIAQVDFMVLPIAGHVGRTALRPGVFQ